jgi:hypothetical protein
MAPYYANAVRAEPGRCFRMVSIATGYRVGSPTDCPEPVRWVGRRQVGKKRMRLWSCEGHAEGLEDLRRLSPSLAGHSIPHGSRPPTEPLGIDLLDQGH